MGLREEVTAGDEIPGENKGSFVQTWTLTDSSQCRGQLSSSTRAHWTLSIGFNSCGALCVMRTESVAMSVPTDWCDRSLISFALLLVVFSSSSCN